MFACNKRIKVLIFRKFTLLVKNPSFNVEQQYFKKPKLLFYAGVSLFFSHRPEGKDYSVHRIILGTHTYVNPLLLS